MDNPIRLLVLARQPLRLEDLGLEGNEDFGEIQLIRRPEALDVAMEELRPNVIIVDVAFPERRGLIAIDRAVATLPDVRVLALTADPPPHVEVSRAIRSGAGGFIDVDAEPDEFASAIQAVHDGDSWLPSEHVRAVLGSVAEDLDVTAAERRSRFTGVVIGIIPVAGAVAAILALLWRTYLGQIGVRPVDLGIDPTTRLVDTFSLMLIFLGFFGPLLYVGNWMSLVRRWAEGRQGFDWVTRHPVGLRVILSLAWLAIAVALETGLDLILVLVVGPVVFISMVAVLIGASDDLPSPIRMTAVKPVRLIVGTLTIAVTLLGVVSIEVHAFGPDLRTDGAHGVLAPQMLGFGAQPMNAIDVNGDREPRDVLYLGGNADLYVLVDPCEPQTVEYVSVGSTRLIVIDEVSCENDG